MVSLFLVVVVCGLLLCAQTHDSADGTKHRTENSKSLGISHSVKLTTICSDGTAQMKKDTTPLPNVILVDCSGLCPAKDFGDQIFATCCEQCRGWEGKIEDIKRGGTDITVRNFAVCIGCDVLAKKKEKPGVLQKVWRKIKSKLSCYRWQSYHNVASWPPYGPTEQSINTIYKTSERTGCVVNRVGVWASDELAKREHAMKDVKAKEGNASSSVYATVSGIHDHDKTKADTHDQKHDSVAKDVQGKKKGKQEGKKEGKKKKAKKKTGTKEGKKKGKDVNSTTTDEGKEEKHALSTTKNNPPVNTSKGESKKDEDEEKLEQDRRLKDFAAHCTAGDDKNMLNLAPVRVRGISCVACAGVPMLKEECCANCTIRGRNCKNQVGDCDPDLVKDNPLCEKNCTLVPEEKKETCKEVKINGTCTRVFIQCTACEGQPGVAEFTDAIAPAKKYLQKAMATTGSNDHHQNCHPNTECFNLWWLVALLGSMCCCFMTWPVTGCFWRLFPPVPNCIRTPPRYSTVPSE